MANATRTTKHVSRYAAPCPTHTTIPNKESLAALMRKSDLTLEELVKRTGIRYHTLYQAIHGSTTRLTENQMRQLTQTLHCTVHELTSPRESFVTPHPQPAFA